MDYSFSLLCCYLAKYNFIPSFPFLSGLGQVLEFMYTAKLNLSSQNVEDVLAVATFLQMQEIVNACSAYQTLAVSSTDAPAHDSVTSK